MNLRKFSPDPIINRLTHRYEIDDCVVVIQFQDGNYLIPEPYLSNLKANPWVCSLWEEQDNRDCITFEHEWLADIVSVIKTHGYRYVLMAHSDIMSSEFYANSQS